MYREFVATADNDNRVYTCVLQFANAQLEYTDSCTTYFYVNREYCFPLSCYLFFPLFLYIILSLNT
jgi:hypothetical protein